MWVDNPLFVKHVRSRLRRGQLLTPAVVVGAICLLTAYACEVNNWYTNGSAFAVYLAIQVVAVGLMGSTQVSSAVGGARESGILDFHRVSPLSPLAVTLGFFFGAPVREYVLAAMTLPFVLICAAKDAPGLGGVIQVEVATLVSCWLLHAIAILTSLATKKPKASTKGAVGAIVFLLIFTGRFGFIGLAALTGAVTEAPTIGFFGAHLPWLAFLLIYALPLIFFLMLASVRKMKSERSHPFTKPEALAALAIEAALVLGAVWSGHDLPYLPLFVIYATASIALVLIITITPNLGEFTKGFRRAEREGKRHVGYWDDLAPNRVAVVALCGIVLLASTIAWYFIAPGPFGPAWAPPPAAFGGPPVVVADRAPWFTIPIAVAVLSVAEFGLALQFFLLRAPRRGSTLLGLFVFAAWILPPLLGSILTAARVDKTLSLAVIAISPVAGISLSTDMGPASDTGTELLKLAALIPALVFALLFNNGVTWARRRAVAEIHGGPGAAKAEPVPDPLAA